MGKKQPPSDVVEQASPEVEQPPMFREGDAIAHPTYGAGRVLAIQKWKIGGVERRYYSIEMVNDQGTLMIPVEQAEGTGLRLAISGTEEIAAVLAEAPEALDSDHRKRQTEIATKIHSGDAMLVSEALRDLAWREHTGGLTDRDSRLMSEAEAMLAGELALNPDLTLQGASEQIEQLVEDAIDVHDPPEESDVSD
jgi:RNA polymerase-interacting CarD/CdnL/TRCF family regulator